MNDENNVKIYAVPLPFYLSHFLFDSHAQLQSHCAQDRVETFQSRISIFRQRLVQTFSVQRRLFRDARHTALRIDDITQRQQQGRLIAFFQRCIEVGRRLRRVAQRVQKGIVVGFTLRHPFEARSRASKV